MNQPSPIISTSSIAGSNEGRKFKIAFILITSLFFLWGFAISMLDVLNKHFQEVLNISIAESAWIQVATFGAYFLMALPAGWFMKKYGYKKGILFGLLLYSGGALLVYPASEVASWPFFLVALFILACGLAFLETAANPYATVLGPKESSAQRLNLAQSFNGLGVITGPLVGGFVVFAAGSAQGFKSVQLPYVLVGGIVLLVAFLFLRTPLPEIPEELSQEAENLNSKSGTFKALFRRKHFVMGVIAQFVNVGAQGCIWGLFINYVTVSIKITNQEASYLQSVGMVIFMSGRFLGTYLMKFIDPGKLLGIYGAAMVGLLIVVTGNFGMFSIAALMAFFLFQSITFPTIFALGIKDLGSLTKNASSFQVMAIVGGAVFPPLMGYIADSTNMAVSFILPTLFFAYIAWYGFKGAAIR